MPKEKLVEYLGKCCELELEIDGYSSLINSLNFKRNWWNRQEEQKLDRPCDSIFSGVGNWWTVIKVAYVVYFGLFVAICLYAFMEGWENVLPTFAIPIICAVSLGVFYCTILKIRVSGWNRDINIKNRAKEASNSALRTRKYGISNQCNAMINTMNASINDARNVLNSLYLVDILYPKYRNKEAVLNFLDYFLSGRCETLEGPFGAYNKYEDELRQGIIINKLDLIISKLDDISFNQRQLMQSMRNLSDQINSVNNNVCNCVDKFDYVGANSAISAYNSQRAIEHNRLMEYYAIKHL